MMSANTCTCFVIFPAGWPTNMQHSPGYTKLCQTTLTKLWQTTHFDLKHIQTLLGSICKSHIVFCTWNDVSLAKRSWNSARLHFDLKHIQTLLGSICKSHVVFCTWNDASSAKRSCMDAHIQLNANRHCTNIETLKLSQTLQQMPGVSNIIHLLSSTASSDPSSSDTLAILSIF